MDTNEDETLLIRVHSCDSWDKSILSHRSRQIVLLNLPIQRPLPDPQDLCRLLPVPVHHLQRVADEFFFGLGDADADEVRHAAGDFAADGAELLGEAFGAEHRARSEEHTSELQSQSNLVCRLLLEKK